MKKYDVIIIGAGPAGMTASIYTTRRALKTLLISMDVGGQVATTPDIENYPGFEMISGVELSQKMMEQVKKFEADVELNEEIEKIEKKEDKYLVSTNDNSYEADAIVLAFGKTPRKLGVPGDDKFQGKGISYCANCDGPFFKGKTVSVIGGGNSALDAALYLSKLAKKVYLVHRRDEFRGDETEVERVKDTKNIELVLNSTVSEVIGSDVVEKIRVKDVKTEEEREIETDGVFVEIGFVVAADFVKELVKVDERNQIIIDMDCRTSDPGIMAAGDVTQTPYKQIVIAGGQGATAALTAYDYIQKKRGKPTVRVDWGAKK